MAAVADYDNALVSLTGDVANSYILIRTLEKRLKIAHQNVAVQKKSLQIATARWQGGTTSKRDVEQAQTVLDSTEATIPTLEGQWRQTQNALCVLMGLPPSDLGDLLGSKSEIPAPPPQVAIGIPGGLDAAAAGYPERRVAGRGPMRPNRRGQGQPLPGLFLERHLWAPGQ